MIHSSINTINNERNTIRFHWNPTIWRDALLSKNLYWQKLTKMSSQNKKWNKWIMSSQIAKHLNPRRSSSINKNPFFQLLLRQSLAYIYLFKRISLTIFRHEINITKIGLSTYFVNLSINMKRCQHYTNIRVL